MADVFDTLNSWLLSRAIEDADLDETLGELCTRLVDAGIPICRFVIGRGLAHPIIGIASLTWESDRRYVEIEVTPPTQLSPDQIKSTPFGHMAFTGERKLSALLVDEEQRLRFRLFSKLADQGITHYLGFSRRFTPPDADLPSHQSELKGTMLAICTKRAKGFREAEIDGIERLVPAICVCVRVALDRMLVTELMARYLGRATGARVLTGQTARGDGTEIDCALFYSDMRNSVGHSQQNSMENYLQVLNTYFDCTAGAVLDHGGEILKFIGDGILAIFPFEAGTRPPEAMCAAAVSSAQEAFARIDGLNKERFKAGAEPLSCGIALHAGTVIYGNVGTEMRLDFTATGPSVGLVSRCEETTKELGVDIIATDAFVEYFNEGSELLGEKTLRGFSQKTRLFSFSRR